MRLIDTENHKAGQDLGSLWREAERLGRVEVDWEIIGENYRAEITFKRATGSTIRAVGRSKIIEQAMAGAIIEARGLGAG